MGNAVGSDALSDNDEQETDQRPKTRKRRKTSEERSGSPEKKHVKLNTPDFL